MKPVGDITAKLGTTLGSHTVSLRWFDNTPHACWGAENDGRGRVFVTSGFIVSIRDQWFLITAGHVLQDILQARSNGQQIRKFHLCDAYASPHADMTPIPFPFQDLPHWYYHSNTDGHDYAAVYLGDHYRRLLESNGICSLDETMWRDYVPDAFDSVLAIGYPSNFVSAEPQGTSVVIESSLVVIPLTPAATPAEFQKPYERLCYTVGNVKFDQDNTELASMDGMSGCPIFGLRHDPRGIRYWLIGVQSSQSENTINDQRYLLACHFQPLGQLLEDLLKLLEFVQFIVSQGWVVHFAEKGRCLIATRDGQTVKATGDDPFALANELANQLELASGMR